MSRISEGDLKIPTLEELAKAPGGFLTTRELIDRLWARFQPTGQDAQIAKNRSDTYFEQKVRNQVSHKGSQNNIISEGLVQYLPDEQGVQITQAGLKKIGET